MKTRFQPLLLAAVLAATGAAAQDSILFPSADTHVGDGNMTKKNYGSADPLEVYASKLGRTTEAYLKFDLPTDRKFVNGARLRFSARVEKPGRESILIRSANTNDWQEGIVNWLIKPEHLKSVGEVQITGVSYSWYELDVTAQVNDALRAGHRTATFVALQMDISPNKVLVHSREFTAARPELILASASAFTLPVPPVTPGTPRTIGETATLPRVVPPIASIPAPVATKGLALRINFQPGDVPVPAGYIADSGEVFGPRGAWQFGWNKDNTRNLRDRSTNKPAVKSPDVRYATFAYFHRDSSRRLRRPPRLRRRLLPEQRHPAHCRQRHPAHGRTPKPHSPLGRGREGDLCDRGTSHPRRRSGIAQSASDLS
jgi:hypothetical protein